MPKFKRGDGGLLSVQFCRGTSLTQLDETTPSVVKFALKAVGVYDTDPVVALASFTVPAVADGPYLGYPNLNTTELDALLAKDLDDTNDLAEVDVNLELTWSEDAELTWLSTETLVARVENDVIRGDEGTPTSAATPAEWLAANGVVYDPEITALTSIAVLTVAVGRIQALRIPAGVLTTLKFYELRASTDADNGATRIRPPDYAATTNEKVWFLQNGSFDKVASVGVIYSDGGIISYTGQIEARASTLVLEIEQGSTGGTLAYASGITFAGGAAPVLSTATGAIDVLTLATFDGGTAWRGVLSKGFA